MFKRKSTTTPRRDADEIVRVSPNLQASVWSASGMHDREHRIHLRLERLSPDGGRTLRTFRPEHLLEMPSAVALLAGGIAKVGTLPQSLRGNLKRLAELLEKVHAELSTNGEASGESSDEENIFG